MAYHRIFVAAVPRNNNMVCLMLTLIGLCNMLIITETATDDTCNFGTGIVPEDPYFLEHEDVVLECFAHQISKKLAFLIGLERRPVDRLCNRTGGSKTTINSYGMEVYPVDSTCIWERNSTYIKIGTAFDTEGVNLISGFFSIDIHVDLYFGRPFLKPSICKLSKDDSENTVTVPNATFLKLVIPRVTALDVREYKRGMHVKCIDAGIEPYTCIDNTYIQLEYFPVEPENITCIVDNFKTLFCSWDLGPVYKFPRNTTITCQHVFNVSTKFNINPDKLANAWAKCPNGTSTSCFWDPNEYHNSRVILLNVSVTNLVRNITVSKNVTVFRDDVLKPAKVENLTIQHTENATCIHVWWKPPFLYRNYTKYNISYSSKCEPTEMTKQFYCDELYRYYCNYSLCQLNPFTEYNLSVTSRYCPERNETGYWSEPTWIVFRTDRAIAKAAPLVTDGLYVYDGTHLTLYWQPLGECDKFSDDTEYEIRINGIMKSYSVTDYVMVTEVRNGNDTSESFDVKIVTKNSEGIAAEDVDLTIFSESFELKDSELIIEYRTDETECKEYLASIRVDTGNLKEFYNITHTIVWCDTTAGACIAPMQWLADVSVASELLLPIQECNETYRFWLITKAYHRLAKKMVWSDLNAVHCEFVFHTIPKEPLPKVKLPEVMLPNTVTVEWEHYPCNKRYPYVENYIVTYCEARPPQSNETCDCLKERQEIKVPNKNASHTIKDLDSNLEICVWVSANSAAGRGPKNRNILFCTVQAGEGKGVYVVIAVILSLVIFICLIIFIAVICWRRFNSRMKEVKRIEDPIRPNPAPDDGGAEHEYPLLVCERDIEVPIEYITPPINPYADISDEDSGNEARDGYARPDSIVCSSYNSVNSELTQNGGNEEYIDTLDGQLVHHNETNDFDETDTQTVDSQSSNISSGKQLADLFKAGINRTSLLSEYKNSKKDDITSLQKDENYEQNLKKDITSNSHDDMDPDRHNDNAASNQKDTSSNILKNITQTCQKDLNQNLQEDHPCQHLPFNRVKIDETAIKERQPNNINSKPIEEVQPRLDEFKANSAYTDSLGGGYSVCASYNPGVQGKCGPNNTTHNLAGYSTYGELPEKDSLTPTYSTSIPVKSLSEPHDQIDQNYSKIGIEPKALNDKILKGMELCDSNTLQLEQHAPDKVLASNNEEKNSLSTIKPSLGTVTSTNSSKVPENGGCKPNRNRPVTQNEKEQDIFKQNGRVEPQVMTGPSSSCHYIVHKNEEQSTSATTTTTGTSIESKSSGSLPDYICADNNSIPQG